MTQTTTMIGGIKEESKVEHNWQQHACEAQDPGIWDEDGLPRFCQPLMK